MVHKDRKSLIESEEGYTYMSSAAEEKVSVKILTFLAPVEFSKWGVKVRRCLKKLKVDQLSDIETEYADLD